MRSVYPLILLFSFALPIHVLGDEFRVPLRLSWAVSLYDEGMFGPQYLPEEPASPIVSEGKVFVGGTGNVFIAINAKTGKILWKFQTEGSVDSKPAYDDGIVFFGASDGLFYALDSNTGNVIWKYKLSSEILSTPLIYKGKIYFITQNNTLYALDKEKGAWKWQYARETHGKITIRGRSSPAVKDDMIYMGFSDGTLVCLDIETGREIWTIPIGSGKRFNDIVSSPILEGNLMYISSYDGQTSCLNRKTGDVQWSFEEGGSNDLAIGKNHLIISRYTGKLICINKIDGTKAWEYKFKKEIPSTPVVVDDKVIVGTDKTPIYIFDIKTGRIQWRFTQKGGISGIPYVNGNNLYFLTNGGYIYKLSPSTFNIP